MLEASAALIVVSHDRYFLDKVTNRTLELFHGTVESYTGNFSAYWLQKAERMLVQRRTFEKQKEEIEKTKDFIRRNAYGMKHAQAEDRRKKLERLEADLAAPPREIAAPAMIFPPAAGRRHRGTGRARGKKFQQPAVRRSIDRHYPLAAPGAFGTQRLRENHAIALPAGIGTAGQRQHCVGAGSGGGLLRPATGCVWTTTPRLSMPSARSGNNSSCNSGATCWPASA